MSPPARSRRRRLAGLAGMLAGAALLMPDAAPRMAPVALVAVDRVVAVDGHDGPEDVVWVLALGSDARPGEPPLRSRADAIQLVGVDLSSGAATVIGIPRDSWVAVPGHGSGRVNSGLELGGPQLMAETVGRLVGISPDYVLVATFPGLQAMVRGIGGVTVRSRLAFTDDLMPGAIRRGRNRLDPAGALFFARARHFLPEGDFDRSANQQLLLLGILRELAAHHTDPGFIERGVTAAVRNLDTDLSPAEVYRLAHAVARVDAADVTTCVVRGREGTVNGASIVFPDTAQARRLGTDAGEDAHLDQPCEGPDTER